MSDTVIEVGNPINLSASGVVSKGRCRLLGYVVNSTTSGTIQILDNGTALGAAATPSQGYNAYPFNCVGPVTCIIGGSALDVTFSVAPAGSQ